MTYQVHEPTFLGYQILGDSQLLRFSKRFSTFPRRNSDGDFSLGLCVSGQKIEDLLRRIRINENIISEKIILMIGTNDLLQNTDFEKMSFLMDRVLLRLIKNGATRIILMTIPPIPKLNESGYHWKTLKQFNEFIRKRHNGKDIFVIDTYARFIEKSPEKIELKPFGLSQHVNRIDSNSDETAVMRSSKKECYGKQRRFSKDDALSLTINNESDESNTWLKRCSHVYNSLSDYTCGTDFSCEVKGDSIKLQYFETRFERNNKVDLIHLNIHGLEQIKKLIVNEYYFRP